MSASISQEAAQHRSLAAFVKSPCCQIAKVSSRWFIFVTFTYSLVGIPTYSARDGCAGPLRLW
jgi:hypothetical protein